MVTQLNRSANPFNFQIVLFSLHFPISPCPLVNLFNPFNPINPSNPYINDLISLIILSASSSAFTAETLSA